MSKSATTLHEALKPLLHELEIVESNWQKNFGSKPRKNWTFTIDIECVRKIRDILAREGTDQSPASPPTEKG